MYLSLSVDSNPTVHAAIARVLQAELAMLFLLEARPHTTLAGTLAHELAAIPTHRSGNLYNR